VAFALILFLASSGWTGANGHSKRVLDSTLLGSRNNMWMPLLNDCNELRGYRLAAILPRMSNVPGYPLLGGSARRHSMLGMLRWPSCGSSHARGRGVQVPHRRCTATTCRVWA